MARELLHRFERGTTIHTDNAEGIASLIEEWAGLHTAGTLPVYPIHDTPVRMFSRPHLTERFAGILDHVSRS